MEVLMHRNSVSSGKKNNIAAFLFFFSFAELAFLVTGNFSVFLLYLLLSLLSVPIMPIDRRMFVLLLAIFAVSNLFMYAVYYGELFAFGSPYTIGGSDDLRFEQLGSIYYQNGWFDFTKKYGYSTNTRLYVTFIAGLHWFSEKLGGFSTFLPRISNIFFELWSWVLFSKILSGFHEASSNTTLRVIAILGFFPNIKYLTAHVYRDPSNLLLLLLSCYLLYRLLRAKSLRKILYIILIAFVLFLSYYLRSQALLFTVFALLIMLLKPKLAFTKHKIVLFLFAIVLILVDYVANLFGLFSTHNTYSLFQSEITGLSRTVLSIPLIPFGLFARSLYGIATPFPNFFGLFRSTNSFLYDLLYASIYFGTILQLLSIPVIIRRFMKFDWISACFILFFSLYSLGTFTFRHLLFAYPFMAVLYVEGINGSKSSFVSWSRITMITLFVLFAAVYMILSMK